MLKVPKKPKSDFLYHYSSAEKLEFLKPIILNNELYFPTGRELNDPAESRVKLTCPSGTDLDAYLRELHIKNHPNLREQDCAPIKYNKGDSQQQGKEATLEKISQYLYDLTSSNHRIYSLSKRYDNMALWAHYADGHKGYCLEFKTEGLFSKAYEVEYTDEEWTFDATKPDEANGYFFWVKNTDWRNEEEVRIVTPSSMKPPFKFTPSSLLHKVILGYKMEPSHKSQIIQWARGRVQVMQATYSTSRKLELKEV